MNDNLIHYFSEVGDELSAKICQTQMDLVDWNAIGDDKSVTSVCLFVCLCACGGRLTGISRPIANPESTSSVQLKPPKGSITFSFHQPLHVPFNAVFPNFFFLFSYI